MASQAGVAQRVTQESQGRRGSQAEQAPLARLGCEARRESEERKVMMAPRVKRVCLANLETGVPGAFLATVVPLGRRVTWGTQDLKAGMAALEHQGARVTVGTRGPLDPRDELSMLGSEE